MMNNSVIDENNVVLQIDDGHTTREEAAGRKVWEKLQAKELGCAD